MKQEFMKLNNFKFLRGYIKDPRILGGERMAYAADIIIRIGNRYIPCEVKSDIWNDTI